MLLFLLNDIILAHFFLYFGFLCYPVFLTFFWIKSIRRLARIWIPFLKQTGNRPCRRRFDIRIHVFYSPSLGLFTFLGIDTFLGLSLSSFSIGSTFLWCPFCLCFSTLANSFFLSLDLFQSVFIYFQIFLVSLFIIIDLSVL